VSSPRVCLERRHKGDDDSGDHDGKETQDGDDGRARSSGTARESSARSTEDDSASHDASRGLTAARLLTFPPFDFGPPRAGPFFEQEPLTLGTLQLVAILGK